MEHHRKKPICPCEDSNLRRRSQSTDMLCSRPSCIPKKQGSSPHVARCFFFNVVPYD